MKFNIFLLLTLATILALRNIYGNKKSEEVFRENF